MHVLYVLVHLTDLFVTTAPLWAGEIEHFKPQTLSWSPVFLVKQGFHSSLRELESSNQIQLLGLVEPHKILAQLVADLVEIT